MAKLGCFKVLLISIGSFTLIALNLSNKIYGEFTLNASYVYGKNLASIAVKNFNENIDRIKDMGFDQYFINLWNYYFSYCEAGFANNTIDDVQLVIKGGIANA